MNVTLRVEHHSGKKSVIKNLAFVTNNMAPDVAFHKQMKANKHTADTLLSDIAVTFVECDVERCSQLTRVYLSLFFAGEPVSEAYVMHLILRDINETQFSIELKNVATCSKVDYDYGEQLSLLRNEEFI